MMRFIPWMAAIVPHSSFSKLVFLFGLMIISGIYSISLGAFHINPLNIPFVLLHQAPAIDFQILWNVRIPRVLIGGLVGASLAVSGTILQGILRNPLAAPNIIGVTSGAGFVGYLLLIAFPAYATFLPIGSFLGALGASLLVYSLAWKDGVHPYRLIMAGVAVSASLGAGMSVLMLLYPDRIQGVLVFMVGGLGGISWPSWHMAWPYVLAGLCCAWVLSGILDILGLGDATASSLGLRVELYRFLLLAIAALLAATAVSVAGLLGFVGLIVPNMMRVWIGPQHKILLPASAMGGCFLVLSADTLGRLVMAPMEFPVGIPMALLGGPFFLYLLRSKTMKQ